MLVAALSVALALGSPLPPHKPARPAPAAITAVQPGAAFAGSSGAAAAAPIESAPAASGQRIGADAAAAELSPRAAGTEDSAFAPTEGRGFAELVPLPRPRPLAGGTVEAPTVPVVSSVAAAKAHLAVHSAATATGSTVAAPLPRPGFVPAAPAAGETATAATTDRPAPNEPSEAPAQVGAASVALAVPIPLRRPQTQGWAQPAPAGTGSPAADMNGGGGLVAAGTPKPPARPNQAAKDAPFVRAMLVLPEGKTSPAPRLGGDMVCRDPRITGARTATFVGHTPGCGIIDPVRVSAVGGIRLSAPITVDCGTARTLADWATGVVQPAARDALGTSVASLTVMGSYTCRPRNNRPGARLSEHSVGRAVDIGGVKLADGRSVAVKSDWGRGAAGTFLRRAWKGACGGFTTVIGPDGDRYHQDHLHLDTAWRDSKYCR